MTSKLDADVAALISRFTTEFVALLRRAPLGELERLLESVPARGRTPRSLSATTVSAWAERYGLSAAEAAVFDAAVRGKSHREIALERGTAPSTTKRQISTLLRKTGDRSMLAAVGRFLRERI